ncbi:hypothetical protein NL676_020247 [Syzygium grande]|nr:hypothetical protein NL676_020247 [Syzygium grande]
MLIISTETYLAKEKRQADASISIPPRVIRHLPPETGPIDRNEREREERGLRCRSRSIDRLRIRRVSPVGAESGARGDPIVRGTGRGQPRGKLEMERKAMGDGAALTGARDDMAERFPSLPPSLPARWWRHLCLREEFAGRSGAT